MNLEILLNGFNVKVLEDSVELFKLKIKDKSFLWSHKISVYEDEHEYGKISSSSFSFTSNLKIGLQDYQMSYEASGLAGYYKITGNTGLYEVIPHKGNIVSIFKNNIQIGYYKNDFVNILQDQRIVLLTEKNVKLKLLIMIILNLEFSADGDRSFLNVNFGNIGGELRAFDNTWSPNEFS